MSEDVYMDKLNEILTAQAEFGQRLAKIEEVFLADYAPDPTPAKTGGLYDFVRPDPVEPRYGLGVEMTSPDVAEAKERACYGVNWRGGQALSGWKQE